MKILLDMNLSPAWVPFLTSAGHQAEHWASIGPNDATDETILAHAWATGAVVMTHDLDFGTLLAASGENGPSVIQIREPLVTPVGIGTEMLAALIRFESDLI